MKKIVLISSTNGSVISTVLKKHHRKSIYSLVSDRKCGALEKALSLGIPRKLLSSDTGLEFSDKLYQLYKAENIDLFISFYTKIFSGKFLNLTKDKLINFHPSILPACPGLDGFGDTIKSGGQFIGSTVHFIDSDIDTGKPILQAITPLVPSLAIKDHRHKVFIQQCKMFIQIIEWLEGNRITPNGITNAKYNFSEFVPNLESPFAIKFNI